MKKAYTKAAEIKVSQYFTKDSDDSIAFKKFENKKSYDNCFR